MAYAIVNTHQLGMSSDYKIRIPTIPVHQLCTSIIQMYDVCTYPANLAAGKPVNSAICMQIRNSAIC